MVTFDKADIALDPVIGIGQCQGQFIIPCSIRQAGDHRADHRFILLFQVRRFGSPELLSARAIGTASLYYEQQQGQEVADPLYHLFTVRMVHRLRGLGPVAG